MCVLSSKCNSALLRTVDNYAVLQLDVVWCYQALQQLDCLNDARERLERAEDCFKRCYGEQQSRLQQIKVWETPRASEHWASHHTHMCVYSICHVFLSLRVTPEERTCCFWGSICSRVCWPIMMATRTKHQTSSET